MATTRRRKGLALIQQLVKEPHRFEFLQAMRILEAAVIQEESREKGFAHKPVASWVPPNYELVRFKTIDNLAFRSADLIELSAIDTVESSDANAPQKQWQLVTGFMGLTGSQGVLPHYFTEMLLQLQRNNDSALEDFVNIINHRSISLFYQASRKYQLPINYERHKRFNDRALDLFSHAFGALSGIGLSSLGNRLAVPDEAIFGFGGLLSRPIRSASGLKGIIQHYFGIKVQIEQFCPQWQDLPDDVVTRLPGGEFQGLNNILGVNSLLGLKSQNIQSKFRIKLEPMSYEFFMTLAPGSQKLKALQSLIQFYSGTELDYEICVSINDSEVPPAKLDRALPPMLGWNSHITSPSKRTELVEINVSKDVEITAESLPLAV